MARRKYNKLENSIVIEDYKITYGDELKRLLNDAIEDLLIDFAEMDPDTKEYILIDYILNKLEWSEQVIIICYGIIANLSFKELDSYFDADYNTMRKLVILIKKKINTYIKTYYEDR